MGLFNRGQSISGMWLDGNPAIQVFLGDVLVWDGTSPAFVNVPRALASALAVAPAVRADASIAAIRAFGSSSAIAPSLTAFATVDPETAVIVTAQASAPAVRADSIIMVESITVGAQALPAVAAQSSSATVEVSSVSVSLSVPAPTIAAHFTTTVPAIAVNASAQVPVITATGAAVVNSPVAAVNATARIPVVSGNSSVVAFDVTADATAKTPAITATSNVSPPKATATGLARVPVVQGINFQPQGMNLTSNFTFKTTTPVIVTPMAARAALPTSVVTANKLIMQNPGPVRAAWIARITTYSGDTVTGSIWNNGTLVSAGAAIANPPFNRGAIISGQTAGFTVAQGDGVELRVRAGQASFDQSLVAPDVQLNIYKADQPSAVGARTTNQTGITTWADLIPSSVPAGAVMSGNAFVAQFSHPEMLLAADLITSSPYAIAVRILVNGVDVGITGTAGANDGRLTAAGRANIVAGDLILVQAQRTGSVGTLGVNTGSTWGIV
ncbi:hypothetical protein [Rhodococcus erythropolis]|uniref:hypothetical protein n=1 Tax=Rhodococcus erythropolis TaxID=1833 RepID=UPI002227CA24|nr:hypothetical protein [Rhodococcus erythropolis]MCW2300758.1 hypothetical protein [Rhodococcus erythropolis]